MNGVTAESRPVDFWQGRGLKGAKLGRAQMKPCSPCPICRRMLRASAMKRHITMMHRDQAASKVPNYLTGKCMECAAPIPQYVTPPCCFGCQNKDRRFKELDELIGKPKATTAAIIEQPV